MRVLVACEYSGVVREAFRKKGHDAWSCDLLPTDIPGQHIQGDAIEVINGGGWDLMIAHPPCTYISNAGAVHYFGKKAKNVEDRRVKGLKACAFFLTLLCSKIGKICVENPQPLSMFCLPKHTQVIQPYMFGHPYSKRTLLWLKNLPELIPTNYTKYHQSTKIPGNWFNKGGKDRQKNRSKTFQGIADAMAEQWGSL